MPRQTTITVAFSILLLRVGVSIVMADETQFVGTVIDADTLQPIAARIYLQDQKGQWHFVTTADEKGSAVPYAEQWVPMPNSVDQHTTVSAHPFQVQLPAGRYRLTIERGKEYHPLAKELVIGDDGTQTKTFRLQRWVDMARRHWYSGETHVHRRVHELHNVMLAEDLNVAFPVTYWTTSAEIAPHRRPSSLRRQGPSPLGDRKDFGSKPIHIDPTHVILPRNTEYEIFSVRQQNHVLGAMFILNHQTPFNDVVPPVGPVAQKAHQENALIDLDKHNWPWSLMLVPIAKVDLFELANNSLWRTNFGFRQTMVAPAEFMQVESDEQGLTEFGWIQFGWETYYMLLNCGFRLQPTAGTASGVHPVPLGFGRVYVHLPQGFSVDAWLDGLRNGQSFVTTGPMLFLTVDNQDPGHQFTADQQWHATLKGRIVSDQSLEAIELVVNGQVHSLPLTLTRTEHAFEYAVDHDLTLERSSWLAVRCHSRNAKGRIRFAHSAPWHVQIRQQRVHPKRHEVEYLIQQMQRELSRNRELLSQESLAEFQSALEFYQDLRP